MSGPTINVDTGAVFGGKLTALCYPKRELVSVPAARTYYVPARAGVALRLSAKVQASLGAEGAAAEARQRSRNRDTSTALRASRPTSMLEHLFYSGPHLTLGYGPHDERIAHGQVPAPCVTSAKPQQPLGVGGWTWKRGAFGTSAEVPAAFAVS